MCNFSNVKFSSVVCFQQYDFIDWCSIWKTLNRNEVSLCFWLVLELQSLIQWTYVSRKYTWFRCICLSFVFHLGANCKSSRRMNEMKKKMLHVIGTRAYDWKWAIRLNLKVEVNPLFDRINNWFFFSTCFAVWKKRLPGKTFRRQTIQTLVKCSDSSTIKCCIVHTMTRRSNRRR